MLLVVPLNRALNWITSYALVIEKNERLTVLRLSPLLDYHIACLRGRLPGL